MTKKAKLRAADDFVDVAADAQKPSPPPPTPSGAPVDIKAFYARLKGRFPNILAELAK